MSDEDRSLLQNEFKDVRPLRTFDSNVLPARPKHKSPGQTYRRESAQRPLKGDENFLPSAILDEFHPNDILSFRRNGIQTGVFHSLMQGKYPIEATLDLHLLTIDQARTSVFQFIKDCQRYEVRLALINHGKGAKRKDSLSIMKSCVARWLPMFPEVLAFHSAQRFHGGTGAVYVLLRKSEKAKERTRESLGLKSSKSES